MSLGSRFLVATVATASLLVVPAAGAATGTLKASAERQRTCEARLLNAGTAGIAQQRFTAADEGMAWVRLRAAQGDWDVALFNARNGKRLAGAAGFGATEVAAGYVERGTRIIVQACRRDSSASRARIETGLTAMRKPTGRLQILRVETPQGTEVALMEALGIDLTEERGAGFVEVLIKSAREERLLRAAGLTFSVEVPDMVAASRATRRADARSAAEGTHSDLPSGRSTYRYLEDYESDMKRLVERYPDIVRPLTLPHPTLEGRTVQGVEITSDVDDLSDGKPVFAQFGAHHAREWPSSEHVMEFAFDLAQGYGSDARITGLVDRVRTILVPIVNVDGFNLSRRAPEGAVNHEYKRKNCRVTDGALPEPGACLAAPANRGVDPNRNYGGLWGGPGAATSVSSETYRGASPFSEPETQNVRELVTSRDVTVMITNHTYGGLVLRPPGVAAYGWAPDEGALKALGDRMASRNGYVSQYSWQLYDTNGTTEDYSYSATGGLGYTFEIGTGTNFHVAYSEHVIDEYLGRGAAKGAGKGGNRAAYFDAMEATADEALHGVITGDLSAGHQLTLSKTFSTATARVIGTDGTAGPAQTFPDQVQSTYDAERGGAFEWHVNPSTRPAVRGGRAATGQPQTAGFALTPPAVPLLPTAAAPVTVNGAPSAPVRTDSASVADFLFTVTAGQDNGFVQAKITWAQTADNWDLYLLRKEANGTLTELGRSKNSNAARTFEELESVFVNRPGDYIVRVQNQQALRDPRGWSGEVRFSAPEPPESYTLTCRSDGGAVLSSRQLFITRGERVAVGDPCRP